MTQGSGGFVYCHPLSHSFYVVGFILTNAMHTLLHLELFAHRLGRMLEEPTAGWADAQTKLIWITRQPELAIVLSTASDRPTGRDPRWIDNSVNQRLPFVHLFHLLQQLFNHRVDL